MKSIAFFLSRICENQKILALTVFLLSILVSLVFLGFFKNIGPAGHQIPGTDYSSCYKPFAENILSGNGILIKATGEICSAIGYPVFLAAVFLFAKIFSVGELNAVVFFNVILTALSAVFLFLITKEVFNKRIGLLASLLWMTYPFNQWLIKNPNSEIPFILFLLASVWFYFLGVRKKDFKLFFLTGIILGSGVLVRPIGLLLPLLFSLMIFLLIKNKTKLFRLAMALTILAGVFIPIFTWEGILSAKTGRLVILADGAGESASAGLTFVIRDTEGGDHAKVPQGVMELMEKIYNANFSTPDLAKFLIKQTINQPLPMIELITIKMARSWYATGQMWLENKILILQMVYILSGFFGIIYCLKKHRDKRREAVFLLAIILFFWLMTTLVLSILRYMIPAMAFVIIFSAVLLEEVIKIFNKKIQTKIS